MRFNRSYVNNQWMLCVLAARVTGASVQYCTVASPDSQARNGSISKPKPPAPFLDRVLSRKIHETFLLALN